MTEMCGRKGVYKDMENRYKLTLDLTRLTLKCFDGKTISQKWLFLMRNLNNFNTEEMRTIRLRGSRMSCTISKFSN